MLLTQNKGFGCGIAPIFDGRLTFSESHRIEKRETENIKKFLALLNFIEAPVDIINNLATLIYKYTKPGYILFGQELVSLAPKGTTADSLRSKLSFYIEKNYERVRNAALDRYGCDIGDKFDGNKNFVRKMASLYLVYGR